MRAGTSIAILGVGAVGLAAVMAARVAGASHIIAVDINAHRLALAAELGATHTIDARTEDVAARTAEITGAGVDYSLEITGLPKMLRMAVDLLAPLGVAALIGGAPAGAEAPIDMNGLLGGRTVRGVAQGRTHLSLDKDCPEPRSVQPPSAGNVVAFPQVGGLHHRYERRAA